MPARQSCGFQLQRHVEIGDPVTGGGIGCVQEITVVTFGAKYGDFHCILLIMSFDS